MKNKQQLKNALLLLLALSILAVYVYSKTSGSPAKPAEVNVGSVNTQVVQTPAAPEETSTGIANPAPKAPAGGGLPAPKPNQ